MSSSRVAIVTGASRGIGREIALRLAQRGCDIVVAAKSTDPQPTLPGTIYTVADEIRLLGRKALPLKVDVRVDGDIQNMVNETINTFGRIDILICNSGALWWKNVDETPMKRYDLINSVNSRGAFACTQACLPYMKKANYGRIIVMSPPIDLNFLKGKVAYCISKYGMTMLALGLGQEVKGTGISICSLWPATLIESYATINFQMGETNNWRKASILSDCVEMIVNEPSDSVNGKSLIDEEYLQSRGVVDLKKYRYNPDVEPAKAWPPHAAKDDIIAPPKDAKKLPPGIAVQSKL